MTKSIIVAFFATIVPFNLSCAEPSAFGAGDLNSPKPYGLTSNEKVVLETKQSLHNVVVKSNNQANEVDSLRERIDGLQSIVESLSEKSQNNKISLQNLTQQSSDQLKNSDEFDKRLSEITTNNSENIEKIKLVISELSTLIDKINTSYVTKDEVSSLVKSLMAQKSTTKSTTAATGKKIELQNTSSTGLEAMSVSDIYDDAQALFDKKNYTKSLEYYAYLIDKNYKPAYAHYMIGEMNYKRKNFGEAIAYFKKSASLYSKAPYMSSLMLHTAISMDNTDDKKNANAFYKGVIAKYPDTNDAIEAQKKLSLMK